MGSRPKARPARAKRRRDITLLQLTVSLLRPAKRFVTGRDQHEMVSVGMGKRRVASGRRAGIAVVFLDGSNMPVRQRPASGSDRMAGCRVGNGLIRSNNTVRG